MITFSVLLTTYNSSATIGRCLASIFGQEGAGERFELDVWVVDDCSTDDTLTVVAQWPNVTVRRLPSNTGGPNAGRNVALQACRGDYICIVDHDDEWKPDRLLAVLPFIGEAPIVSCGYTIVDAQTGTQTERFRACEQGHVRYQPGATFRALLAREKGRQNAYLGGLVLARECRDVHFEEHFGVVDQDWLLRVFEGRSSIEVCRSLYFRHVAGSNLSLDRRYREIDFHYSLLTIERYRDDYPHLYRTAYKRIHASAARYYYLVGDTSMARFLLRKSGLTLRNALYYATSFIGREWVTKRFNVFG